MARVTVEDCLENVANRFELVLLASKRARQLMRGSVEPTVPWENDKATVVALREIANGHTDFSDSHEAKPLSELQKATEQEILELQQSMGIIQEEHQAPEGTHNEHEHPTDSDE